MKWLLILLSFCITQELSCDDKTVMWAILARNKAHVLPRYLQCLENQDYPKNAITIYIKTDNNADRTKEMLTEWAKRNKGLYKHIEIDDSSVKQVPTNTDPHLWSLKRLKALATIRNKSLQKAKEFGCDYYFVADCDNFLAPCTLKDLVAKDKPMIAPFLRSIPEPDDIYSNFFYEANEIGYYKDNPKHMPIVWHTEKGTFKVDLVHCTYLINTKHLDKLNYIDGTDDYEFIILGRSARKNGVDQYITNEKEYGVQVHFNDHVTLEEECSRLEAILTMP